MFSLFHKTKKKFSDIEPADKTLIGSLTGGHLVIHWFQQLFPIIVPAVANSLGLSGTQVGIMGAARQIGNLMTLPSGIFADAWLRHRATMLVISIIFMGLAYFLIGIAPSFIWVLPGAMLVGLGTAAWHPPAMASLSSRFPENRATALSLHGVGATFGDTLTPIVAGGFLLVVYWRGLLQVQIIVAVVAALILWRLLAKQFQYPKENSSSSDRFSDVKKLIKNPIFVGVSLAQGLMNMARNSILLFLPLYVQNELGYDSFTLGLYIAMLHGMGLVTQPILGILSDRFGRKEVLVPSYVILGFLYIALANSDKGWQLSVVVLAIGIFFYTLTNVTTAAVLDVSGDKIQATSMGLTSLLTQAFSLPSPIIAGMLADSYGLGSTFLLSAVFMFLGAMIFIPLRLYKGSKARVVNEVK